MTDSPSSSVVATTEVEAGPSPCVLYALATTWYDVNLPRPRSENSCDDAPEGGRSMNSRPVVRPTALKRKEEKKGNDDDGENEFNTMVRQNGKKGRCLSARVAHSFVLAADSKAILIENWECRNV